MAGKNDVFVKVSAITGLPDNHHADARTSTVQEGGKNPVWKHGRGEDVGALLVRRVPAAGTYTRNLPFTAFACDV